MALVVKETNYLKMWEEDLNQVRKDLAHFMSDDHDYYSRAAVFIQQLCKLLTPSEMVSLFWDRSPNTYISTAVQYRDMFFSLQHAMEDDGEFRMLKLTFPDMDPIFCIPIDVYDLEAKILQEYLRLATPRNDFTRRLNTFLEKQGKPLKELLPVTDLNVEQLYTEFLNEEDFLKELTVHIWDQRKKYFLGDLRVFGLDSAKANHVNYDTSWFE